VLAGGDIALCRNLDPGARRRWPTHSQIEAQYESLIRAGGAMDCTLAGDHASRKHPHDVIIHNCFRSGCEARVEDGCQAFARLMAGALSATGSSMEAYFVAAGVDMTPCLSSSEAKLSAPGDVNLWHRDMDEFTGIMYFGDFTGGALQHREKLPSVTTDDLECSEVAVSAHDLIVQRGSHRPHRTGPVESGLRWALVTRWAPRQRTKGSSSKAKKRSRERR